MEWLRRFFGFKTAPTAHSAVAPCATEVSHIIASTPDYLEEGVIPTGWPLSEKGNETAMIRGFRVTLYPEGRAWKFCIADPVQDQEDAEYDNDEAYRPYFSDGFPSKEIARAEAMNKVYGRPRQHQSSREIREAEAAERHPQQIIEEEEKLAAIRRSINKLKKGATVQRETVENLLKRTASRARISQHIWVSIYGDDNDQELIERSRLLMESYHAARDEIREILDAFDAKAKE